MNKKKIILFDIDYTLFDTTKFKQLIASALFKLVPTTDFALVDEVYYEVRQKGNFDPQLFAKLFKEKHAADLDESKIERLWLDEGLIQQALYPEVLSTLQKLQINHGISLGIFSAGKSEFQLQKISSLSDFFTKKHIHITDFKEDTLISLMKEYKKEEIVYIDDLITILQKAKLLKDDLFAVWMKRGKFAEQATIPQGFKPDAVITQLDEVLSLVDKS